LRQGWLQAGLQASRRLGAVTDEDAIDTSMGLFVSERGAPV
jgi:hypothetical protein